MNKQTLNVHSSLHATPFVEDICNQAPSVGIVHHNSIWFSQLRIRTQSLAPVTWHHRWKVKVAESAGECNSRASWVYYLGRSSGLYEPALLVRVQRIATGLCDKSWHPYKDNKDCWNPKMRSSATRLWLFGGTIAAAAWGPGNYKELSCSNIATAVKMDLGQCIGFLILIM